MNSVTRRAILGATLAAPVAIKSARAADNQPIRLGGPIFLKSDDPVELANTFRAAIDENRGTGRVAGTGYLAQAMI